MSTESVVAAYAAALVSNDADALINLLGPHPRFVSPFSVWSTAETVEAACATRSKVFRDLVTIGTWAGPADGVVRWVGRVGEQEVEGVDVLSLVDHRVSSIDVYLRPADALHAVYVAMSKAWPSRPRAGGRPLRIS